MKVFCYFVEPASYTLDLIANIHAKRKVSYCFLYKNSLAHSKNKNAEDIYLSNYNVLNKINYVFKIWKKYDFIIINVNLNLLFCLDYLGMFWSPAFS